MKKSIALLLLIVFVGVIMSVSSKPIQFTLCLDGPAGAHVDVFVEGYYFGRTDETGCIECMALSRGDSHSAGINYTLKKVGYQDQRWSVMVFDDQPLRTINYQPSPIAPVTPEPTPELIPEPTVSPTSLPVPTTLSPGMKSSGQRLTDLENTTAEHEQRLTWLEQLVQKIAKFLAGLGFKG